MPSLPHEELKKLYLSHFPHAQRSGAANHLLEAVRAGCTEPDQIVAFAIERAKQKAKWSDYAMLFLMLAEIDKEAIYAGARWALWWESLSPQEKEEYRKPLREHAIKMWMDSQPPTEKQIAYLRDLGYNGPTPESRAEASRLIDMYKRGERHG